MSQPKKSHSGTEIDPPRGGIVVDIASTQGFLAIDPANLAGLVERVLRHEGIARASISVALVDDATIHRINRTHLRHDWPTDVISFVLSDEDDPELAGELIVSAEMARTTAAEIGAEPIAELSLYVVHGLLHLCGYDDTTDEASATMRMRETAALEREGLASTFPLVERRRPTTETEERAAWSG
jgi:probable rRNA maturation factor